MPKVWFIAFIAATFSVIAAYWVYGSGAFVFLPLFLLIFFVSFGACYIGDSIQAKAIHGIQELEKPSFFFSRIYMAWLYVNDRKKWAEYTASFSYLLGCLLGSLFGFAISFSLRTNASVSLAGWILGMFITFLAATIVATSESWTETEEYANNNY